jgi:hypothetical protein
VKTHGIQRIFIRRISLGRWATKERRLKYGLPVTPDSPILRSVSTLAKIQAATETLPVEQQEELYRFLGARLHPAPLRSRKAQLVRKGGDMLLAAPSGAPPMTAENVKRMLEDWP